MTICTRRTQGSYAHMAVFFSFLAVVSLFFDKPHLIMEGIQRIWFSPSNLLTDYMEIAGVGAALLNSSLVGLLSLLLLRATHVEMDGAAMAGLVTISGFALFGKNLFNSIPITLGVFIYARIQKVPYKEVAVTSLFATALGPLVSVLSFGLGFSPWIGILTGYATGLTVGFVIVPLAKACVNFHHGFNLYNIGFTAGLIAMFATGILRMFNLQVNTVMILSEGNNLTMSAWLAPLFLSLLLYGLSMNNWSFEGYLKMNQLSGRLRTDFVERAGYGLTLINMALMGTICWLYILSIGGSLNGPTIGAIFTVMGFSAFGAHPANSMPVFVGAYLACVLNIHDPAGTVSVISILFGSTLAPISGYFGPISGLIAGFTHVSMSMNISYLHGGMNLYNNGFSGGFIAAALVPLLMAFEVGKTKRIHREE